MANIIHYILCLSFIGLFLASCFIKGAKRFIPLAISGVLFLFISIDYSIADYRGFGLAISDFSSLDNIIDIIRKQGFYIGKKHMLCFAWLCISFVIGFTSVRIKKDNLKNGLLWIVVLGILGLGAITDYPNAREFFLL